MKYLASSLIALAFATAAAPGQAQDAAQAPPQDPNAGAAAQPDAAAPPAAPAPDTDAPPAAQAATPDAAAPPAQAAPNASPAAPAGVSDSEVDSFAKATVAVQKITADAKLDESAKQAKMAEAVKSAGLEPGRYNDIGKAVSSDPALLAKIRTAMAKYAGPSKG